MPERVVTPLTPREQLRVVAHIAKRLIALNRDDAPERDAEHARALMRWLLAEIDPEPQG